MPYLLSLVLRFLVAMSEQTAATSSKPCSFIFKKSTRRAGLRKRQATDKNKDSDVSDMSSSSGDETTIVTKGRKRKANPLIQSTHKFSGVKRHLNGRPADESSEDDDEKSVVSLAYKSDRSSQMLGPADAGATSKVEIDTEADKDARAIFERARKMQDEGVIDDDGKTYKGINNYKKFIVAKDNTAGSAMSSENAKGPVRAPSNIRSTVRWDYKPDLCKDYKETGYCGFGDSCIFMHDRTDYKSGWQIEMEYDAGQYGADDADSAKYEVPEEDNIPFKCLICRKSFATPVVTKCKHYFCEQCALKHYRTTTRCFVCQAQTHGIFNPAKEIARRIKQRLIEKQDRDNSDEEEDGDKCCTHHSDEEEEEHEESEGGLREHAETDAADLVENEEGSNE